MAALSTEVSEALTGLLDELTHGAGTSGFVLNPDDPGLLASLRALSAVEASGVAPGARSSVAAHADHLRYGLELMNRWSRGEDPFSDADYSASWKRPTVTEEEWEALLKELTAEIEDWRSALQQPRKMTPIEISGVLASVVHLAYHLGAIRQLQPGTRGPQARD